ncbi:MAG: class I SAM-dependent methyltransferase [Candidatus Hodarchaeota archaeon]
MNLRFLSYSCNSIVFTFDNIYEKYFPFTKSNVISRLIEGEKIKILDMGCGPGHTFNNIHNKKNFSYSCGLDIGVWNIIKAKKNGFYDDYIIGDARFIPFRKNFFDLVLCLEVIEHLPKEEGKKLIQNLKHFARDCILSTPSFFYQITESARFGHQSYYTKTELELYGFKVRGIGVKFLFGNKSDLAKLCRILLSPFTYFMPILSSCYIARSIY